MNNLHVAFFPDWRANPYLDLLQKGLENCEVTVIESPVGGPYRTFLLSSRAKLDVLHFHWLYYVYSDRSLTHGCIELAKFVYRMLLARRLGYRIVWTMHNLYPHETVSPFLDRWMRLITLHFCDAVLLHCDQALHLLRSEFEWNGPAFVAPHGNYLGAYKNEITKEKARSILNLPSGDLVFLHLGAIRRYKGLETMVSSFASLDNSNIHLLIAGSEKPEGWFVQDHAYDVACLDPRITLQLRWIEDDEIQNFMNASDFFVAPYHTILSSGSVILALTFGLPVIAPHIGCMPAYISDGAGILFSPEDSFGLAKALESALGADVKSMSTKAFEMAQSLDWSESARITAEAYHDS